LRLTELRQRVPIHIASGIAVPHVPVGFGTFSGQPLFFKKPVVFSLLEKVQLSAINISAQSPVGILNVGTDSWSSTVTGSPSAVSVSNHNDIVVFGPLRAIDTVSGARHFANLAKQTELAKLLVRRVCISAPVRDVRVKINCHNLLSFW